MSERIVYVAAFVPSVGFPDGNGGFEWRETAHEANAVLQQWIDEELKIRTIMHDFVLRAVKVPDDVGKSNDVTAWLDESRELWETESQS